VTGSTVPDPWLAPRSLAIPHVPPPSPLVPLMRIPLPIWPEPASHQSYLLPKQHANMLRPLQRSTGWTQPSLAGDAVTSLALHHASSSASMPAAPASAGASARQSLLACAPQALVLADARSATLDRCCWQMLDPPHSLHVLLRRPCWQTLNSPRSLHWLLRRPCWQIPCMCSSGAGVGRCSIRHTPGIGSFDAAAASAGTFLSVLHVPFCSDSFCLILLVGVSCSTQCCHAPPLACASL